MSKSTTQPFLRLPVRLFTLQTTNHLTPHDVVVYGYVMLLIRQNTGKWTATGGTIPISQLSRESGFKRDTCAASLSKLEEFGFLELKREHGRPTGIFIGQNMPVERASPARSTGMSPFPHEDTSKEVRETRARAHEKDLAPLRSLVLGVIGSNRNRTQDQLRELAHNRFLETDMDFTITEFQSVWESVDWTNLD